MKLREFFVAGLIRRAFPHLQKRLELANAYQRVFGEAGPAEAQIILRDLIQFSGVLALDTDLTGEEALYRCGRRSVGLHILQRLNWSGTELRQLDEELSWEVLNERGKQQDDAA